ncbi:MAG: glycosyltransferase family 2 protein [Chloroflexi bacterium]|nr:glycosyltransferase family 2 protein [Chloroflexota bacterium]
MERLLDVLIPTCDRKTGLAIVLTSLLGQTFKDFNVIVSDQTQDDDYLESVEIQTIRRAFEIRCGDVRLLKHLPRKGMAEQRHFLLSQSSAPYVQFLDDDLLLEPEVLERMITVLRDEKCGFVGCCAIGLSYIHDVRPHQHNIEPWDGRVQPEPFTWETIPWDRHKVHNAANAYHLAQKFAPDGRPFRYKVAWVGANVMYDRAKLVDVGGFSWWPMLPPEHAGEEVMAQFLLLRKHGGCGILPSATYHLELPTLVDNREVNATSLFQKLSENGGQNDRSSG